MSYPGMPTPMDAASAQMALQNPATPQGYPPTAPQGYPPAQPYTPGYGQWPPAAPPKRRVSGKLIGLIVAVGLIVLGLVAWLVVVPAVRGGGSTDLFTQRAPVILKAPGGWGQPVTLPGFANKKVSVIDAMVGDIVAISDGHTLVAVDLKTNAVLWSVDTRVQWLDADDTGNLVIRDDKENTLVVYDALTGRTKGTVQLRETETIILTYSGITVTTDSDTGMMCARDVTAPTVCKWTAPRSKSGGFIIGNNEWLNTNNGVVDWKTGRPAPFGADANTSSDGNHYVAYTIGIASQQVVRVEGDRKDADSAWVYTLQPWDKNKNKPAGKAIPPGQRYWVPGPYIVQISDDQLTVTTYSKASGELLWTFDGNGRKMTNGMMVGNTMSFNDSDYGFFAVDAKTGKPKYWAGGDTDYYRLGVTGTRILYVVNTTDNQLLAFDGNSANFAQLWSTPTPVIWTNDLNFYTNANHIYAVIIDDAALKLWVLNT